MKYIKSIINLSVASLCLLVMTLLTGCGHEEAQGSVKDSTLTIMANLHTATVPSEVVLKQLEELTEAKIAIQWVPDGSYDERIHASFSTGTLPRAVYLRNTASFLLFRESIHKGQFWEIGEYLASFANLNRLSEQVLGSAAVDGGIFGLYQERAGSRQGVIYRKDWADRLGMDSPSTLEDVYNMLLAFTTDDPDQNGLEDTFGLADRGDLTYGAFKTIGSYFGVPNGWGFQEGRLLPEFMFEEYKETMRFFRKLHTEGLINRDFPITSKMDQQQLLVQGKAGVYVGMLGDVLRLSEELKQHDPFAELDVVNRIKGPHGYRVWATPGFGSMVLFPKSSNPKEADLLEMLSFYDRLMSTEVANLLNWGIENVHYNRSGHKAIIPEDAKLMEREVLPYQSLMIGGSKTIPGLLLPQFNLPLREKAEAMMLDNERLLVHDPTSGLHSDTNNRKGIRLSELIRDATLQYIIGLIDEQQFDEAVQRWLDDGGSDIIKEFNG